MSTHKFADDNTLIHKIKKKEVDHLQEELTQMESTLNKKRVLHNGNKSKELRITKTNEKPDLQMLKFLIEILSSTSLLGLTFSNNLKWNAHVKNVIKRLYILTLLKRSGIPPDQLNIFYLSKIRSILLYAREATCNMPDYLTSALSCIEKRALYILYDFGSDLRITSNKQCAVSKLT